MIVVIERIGEKGDGLAQGRAYPRTLPGEVLGEKTSPDRIDPFCSAFGTCGGCKLQHWREEPYREWKAGLLVAALKARGLATEVKPLVMAHGQGRRRVSLHVREVAGQWRAGFMAESSHDLVPIETCPILVPALQTAPQIAAKFGPIFGASDVAMTATASGLDIAIKASRKLADKSAARLDGFMRQNNLARIAVNGETTAQLVSPQIGMGKAQVPLPIGAFLQATAQGEETLAALVIEGWGKSKRIADLFCGCGPFALRIAEQRPVHAFDQDKKAIAALEVATRSTPGLKPIRAEARDLFRNPLVPQELNEFDAVVLDPPRAGAEAQCQMLAKSKVKTIVYVSCDVQTLARDVAVLVAAGYNLEKATPVDQFRYAAHLETVAVLKRI